MSEVTSIWADLERAGTVSASVPLARLTTYRFGGPTRYFAEIATVHDLDRIVTGLIAEPLDVLVIGRGSNLVISDSGFDGLAIRLSGEFLAIEFDDDHAHVGGAVALPRLAWAAVRSGRRGLEFLVGIPGSVGGAVTMNAGCFGSETSEWLIHADLVHLHTGAKRRATPADLEHAYRHSNVAPDELVTSATFRTVPGDQAEGEGKIREITSWRKETQPGGTFNAGSVFKNPEGDAAGRLIDVAGLKGLSVRRASVSERHANFFVASPDARAQDVYDLVATVQARVFEHSGLWLTPEIRFAGEFEDNVRDPRTGADGAPS